MRQASLPVSQEDPILEVSSDGQNIVVQRVDGETLSSVSIQTAENNEAIDVRLVKMRPEKLLTYLSTVKS